jgi:hypothetical protein
MRVINKLAVTTFAFVCSFMTYAESSYIAPLVKESMLLDVYGGNQTVVVGERGHVLVGDSSQLSQVEVPSTVTLTAVDGYGDTLLAVGHDATILRSANAGNTWEVVFSKVDLDRPFLDVMFVSETEAIAIGGYGLFYRTQDAGKTWEQEQQVSLLSDDDNEYLESIADDPEFYQEELNYIFPHFNRLSKRESDLYLVGEAGLIAKSNDKGQSWERFEVDYSGSFFDVQQLPNGMEIAAGLRGNMYVKNSDEQWLKINTCVTTSLNSIVAIDDDVFIVGNNGVVLQLDPSKIATGDEPQSLQAANSEGCRTHLALRKIATDISSSISNAFLFGDVLTAVSANGLQPVE